MTRWVCILLALFATTACQEKVHRKETLLYTFVSQGEGPTREAAIEEAKIRALLEAMETFRRTIPDRERERDLSEQEARSLFERDIRRGPLGALRSFDVLESEADPEGAEWTCRIEARIEESYIRNLFLTDAHILGILPFRVQEDAYAGTASRRPQGRLGEQLHQALVEILVRSRRFRVLERQDMEELEAELDRISDWHGANEASFEELGRLGRRLGADSLLTGTVVGFSLDSFRNVSALTGETSEGARLDAKISYRLLDVPTGEIRWADTIEYRQDLPLSAGGDRLADLAIERAARECALDVVGETSPIRVLASRGDGEILIDQGGDLLEKGDLLSIHAKKESTRDSSGGGTLRVAGELLGHLRVDRVGEARSWCSFLDDSGLEMVMEGCLVRRSSSKEEPEAPAQRTRSGSRFQL